MASQCPRNDRRGVEMPSPALATHCMPGTPTWPQPAARLGLYFSCAVTLSSCNAPQGDLAHSSLAQQFAKFAAIQRARLYRQLGLSSATGQAWTWRYVIGALNEAARGGNINDVVISLRQLEQVPGLPQ